MTAGQLRAEIARQKQHEARHLAEQAEHPEIPHLVLLYTQARIRELTATLERFSL